MKEKTETKDKLRESAEMCEQIGRILAQLPEAAQRDLLMYAAGFKMAYAPTNNEKTSA